jgi:DNA-binding NarL/FixJ family response regulator
MSVIVVDDSLLIREHLVKRLDAIDGARVVATAAGEEEAIRVISHHQPDVVLLDLHLQPGSGLNVLKAARAQGIDCKVFVLTNQTHERFREICHRHGADGFYDKSHEIDSLMVMLRGTAHDIAEGQDRV